MAGGRNSFSNHEEQEEKEKKKKLQAELVLVSQERKSPKGKFDALRVQNEVQSQKVKSFRKQMCVISKKGKHDDELVAALLIEQKYLKGENVKLSQKIRRVLLKVRTARLHNLY